MSTIAWERVSKIIEADALEDLRGHKRLQSPEGQDFLNALERGGYVNDRTEPLIPWLAREFRKGRAKKVPNWGPLRVTDQDPEAYATAYERRHGQPPHDLDRNMRDLTASEFHHWGDWYHSADRRQVPLEQLRVHHMDSEVSQWEKAMADKATAEEHMPHAPEGEVVHRFPDDWTVRKLPASALPFEGWAMRGKPDPRTGIEAPICVGDQQYQQEVNADKTHIYSLRDPQHMPHVTMELKPHRYSQPAPFDIERALRNHAGFNAAPEELKDMLRAYAKNPNWSDIQNMRPNVPGWADIHEHSLGQLFNQLESSDANKTHHLIPDNGEIRQIQGKGNSVPKPEYQARMKNWLSTFSPENRPNWAHNQYPIGDIADINPQHPEHEPEEEYEPDDDQGGYGPHGDYGLAPPPPRPLNYASIMESMPREGRAGDTWDQSDINALYEHSKARNEIPQLETAVSDYQEKRAMPDLQNLEDMNDEYLGAYPGESYEEDPDRWDQAAERYGHSDGQSAFQRAYDGYNEARNELYQSHPPSQIVSALYQKLAPHYAQDGLPNGQPPGYYNFSSETGFAAPQPEQQAYSKVASVKLSQQLYQRWVFSPGTGKVELSDNDGDPIDVRYHTDIARELNEPNLVHGYAYRVGSGWRLFDWDSKPVTDPFVIASVMRQLKASEVESEPQEPQDGSWTDDRNNDWDRMHVGMPT